MKKLKLTAAIILILVLMTDLINSQDWANLNRYKDENTNIPIASNEEDRVVFMGNSITEAWSEFCPDFFENKSFINRGISGQTTPQMLIRFRQDVVSLTPKIVIILAGTNDIAGNTGPSTLNMIMNNIKSMTEIAISNKISVILSSVLPVYDYPWEPGLAPNEKIPVLNKMIEQYADENGILYLDYFSAMVDNRNGLKDEYTYDGVHPNEAGYRIMGPLAEDAIQKTIK